MSTACRNLEIDILSSLSFEKKIKTGQNSKIRSISIPLLLLFSFPFFSLPQNGHIDNRVQTDDDTKLSEIQRIVNHCIGNHNHNSHNINGTPVEESLELPTYLLILII